MDNKLDLIVIGVGTAGFNIARKTRSEGWEVAVIDSRPYGGTCGLRGCDPKKVLVGAAELVDLQRRMVGHGISGDLHIEWSDLMRFKHTFIDSTPSGIEKMFSKIGVATHHGEAHFVDTNSLEMGGEILTAKHIAIATGAKPRELDIPGAHLAITSTDFLELEQLPQHILFIGGGFVSFEFAHIAARAGAQVTILHRGERPLESFDPDLVNELVTASENIGIQIKVQIEVIAIEKAGDQLRAQTSTGESFLVDAVVHGAGRVPDIDGLNLNHANIEYSPQGILVNEYLQSVSNPAVYAAGDAAATKGMPLTPVAATEAHVVSSNLIKGNQRTPNYLGTPSVVFTIPSLAKTGLTETEAREQGLKFTTNFQKMDRWYSSRRTNESHTAFKVLVEEGSERILGAHLLSTHASEVINMFALAIRHNLTSLDIKQTIFVHPAVSSDISHMV